MAALKAMQADEAIVGRWRNKFRWLVLVEGERGYRLLERALMQDDPRAYREIQIRDISVERGAYMYTRRPELEDVEQYVSANEMWKTA